MSDFCPQGFWKTLTVGLPAIAKQAKALGIPLRWWIWPMLAWCMVWRHLLGLPLSREYFLGLVAGAVKEGKK